MRHTIAALTAIAAQGAVAEIISYWGNGGYDQADGSLAQWCAQNEHIDIINLAFLNTFGSGQYPQGTINNCQINGDGSSSGCEQLESDIGTCQSLGKKIFIALGGGGGSPALNSDNDANGVAYSLWNSYANPNVVASGTPRPLGNARIDGWDIDIESDPNSENENGYLATMLNTLRNYFSDDPNNSYYISGAPQCVIPDANMGNSIANAQYDYLNIQFYNNPCGASTVYKDPNDNPDGVGNFNLADWPGYISGGASANAKLLVGMPGNTAEDGPGAAGDYDFVDASDLPKVYDASKGVQGFSGFMIYEVGDTTSDGDLNGCDYFQTLYSVYTTGNTC